MDVKGAEQRSGKSSLPCPGQKCADGSGESVRRAIGLDVGRECKRRHHEDSGAVRRGAAGSECDSSERARSRKSSHLAATWSGTS